jgi:outer membrane protein TolC
MKCLFDSSQSKMRSRWHLQRHQGLLVTMTLLLIGFTSNAWALSLKAALEEAFRANFAIRIERIKGGIAQDQLLAARGQYDPEVFTEVIYEDLKNRQNSIEFTSTGSLNTDRIFSEENIRTRTGIRSKTPLGTSFELFTEINERSNTLTQENPTSLFDPEYETAVGVRVTQPLLREAGPKINNADIELARLNISRQQYRERVLLTNKAVEVVNAFYEILFRQQDLAVKELAVEAAEKRLDASKKKAAAGKVSPLVVAESRTGLFDTKDKQLNAQERLDLAEIRLVQLLGANSTNGDQSNLRAEAVTGTNATLNMSRTELIANALENRPDILAAREALQQAKLRSTVAQNRKLPDLRLVFSYTLNGLERSVSDSFTRAFDARAPGWTAGVRFNLPLLNRQARGEAQAARQRVSQTTLKVERLEAQARLEVTQALRRFRLSERRVQSAQERVKASRLALQAGQQRLAAGRNTELELAELQRDLAASRSQAAAARTDQAKALSEVWAAAGLLLERHGFQLQNSGECCLPEIREES